MKIILKIKNIKNKFTTFQILKYSFTLQNIKSRFSKGLISLFFMRFCLVKCHQMLLLLFSFIIITYLSIHSKQINIWWISNEWIVKCGREVRKFNQFFKIVIRNLYLKFLFKISFEQSLRGYLINQLNDLIYMNFKYFL